jgi:hypothetical protein
MSLFVFLLLGVVMALALSVPSRFRERHAAREWPVYSRPVLTDSERAFHARLLEASPGHQVLCQVQLCRFVEVEAVPARYAVLNRYNRLSADFLICDRSFRPLLVVELDDASHARPAQRVRDTKKDAVLAAAGVPVVRFRGLVPVGRVRERLVEALRGVNQCASNAENVGHVEGKLPYIGGM